ncbi:MAG TPA: 3-hydroxyacyl-CoA dehydrogenase NAD-binding domain-containing protein [Solirubrobacterales bacterium]|nr:3-hydroxyacyl-CoA dehydrogenase NAD-binding domain-containing protein [Solirubrobacterales bacterium]
MAESTIRWERDPDGVVVLTLDDPGRPANTMHRGFVDSLEATIERLEAEREEVTGVVVLSAKKTFFAGGDLVELREARREDVAALSAHIARNRGLLRRLETLGLPVVAGISGAALGGGLEIALACHHRIAVADPTIRLGMPEVTLGLMPGAGGVVRSVRMLGIVEALTSLLLEGRSLSPTAAADLGLVDELVDGAEELLPAAKRWIASGPDPRRPWDRKGFAIPGGGPEDRAQLNVLPLLPAGLRKQLGGADYPAKRHIMAAAVESAQVDFATAEEIETRYFVDLVTGPVAKNMIQAFFFDMQEVRGDRGRSAGREPFAPRTVLVLGAGMMGAGIAYVCAAAGIDVKLKDVSIAAAERGRSYSEKLLERAVERGRRSPEEAAAMLARIEPIVDPAGAAGADLVIEAVFEDPAVKAEAFREIEPHLAPDSLLGSNTSTLPISELADAVSRPADFIGLHFFSPVDRMPLLEIIKGAETSEATLHRALDLATMIGKTPIVVNDSRGFFTSRVIGTYLNEGIAMLAEGVPAPSIEQASLQAGYPTGVLQLCDELNLELMRRIRDTGRAAAEAAGKEWRAHPAEAVLDRMLDEFGRPGRLGGAGFYDYAEGRRTGLWPGLVEAFGGGTETPFADLKERFLFAESVEALRCLEENVIESAADGNIGSLLGIGFPAWTGGVVQFARGYEGGFDAFVTRARELTSRYGARFDPAGLTAST